MTIVLIYPPTCDLTAPYLAIPTLTAWLREHGKKVIPIDANVEAYDLLLRKQTLQQLLTKIRNMYQRLDKKNALKHIDQMHYIRFREVLSELLWVPETIDDAVNVLRDRTGVRFFDEKQYERAVRTVQAGLGIISAAFSPLCMDFSAYRTPFSLLTPEQIKSDSNPDKNPFHESFVAIGDRLAGDSISLIGISIAFPGQVQPGFSLAWYLRQRFPETHITVGGPAITQVLVRHRPENQMKILGPFDSAVLFEGEQAILDLAIALEEGKKTERIIHGRSDTPMDSLPCPDFEGLPLGLYFSPDLVLPYDPSRGCYWGKCAFCHYGLCQQGTARYRERKISDVIDHLSKLSGQWKCRNFYFSQDAFLPKTAHELAMSIEKSELDITWSTDMRPEKTLTESVCGDLKKGGALSMALGIESASPRLLKLINKGVSVDTMKTAVKNLASAGIAVEAMCFNNFPTETVEDAMATLEFIRTFKKNIALFINGRFGISHGSLAANYPEKYGIKKIWQIAGDELGTGLFYETRSPARTPEEQDLIDDAINSLSKYWWLHDYPWAGALSTAHTILWYAKKGKDVFRDCAKTGHKIRLSTPGHQLKSRYDIDQMESITMDNEAEIWENLINKRKEVSEKLYNILAEKLPPIYPIKR